MQLAAERVSARPAKMWFSMQEVSMKAAALGHMSSLHQTFEVRPTLAPPSGAFNVGKSPRTTYRHHPTQCRPPVLVRDRVKALGLGGLKR